ncbi:MAG: plasmid stabilization protein [Bacteroidetes bacterium]|nr:plasmid stabilization protein [Bacteroidota bacterium]
MKIVYSKTIVKDVRKIKNQQIIQGIELVIENIKNSKTLNDIHQVKKLKGHPSACRIRIGDFRLGFYFENNTVKLARFVKRNDIYKVFPQGGK